MKHESARKWMVCLNCDGLFCARSIMKRPICGCKCREQYKTNRKDKQCEICGSWFSLYGKPKTRRFCSQKCVGVHNTKHEHATCYQCGVDIGRPAKNNAKRSHCSKECQALSALKSKSCELCPHCFGKPKVGCCEKTTPKRDPWEVALAKAWSKRRRPDTQCPWVKKLTSCANSLKYRRFECGSNNDHYSPPKAKTWVQALKIPSRVDPWKMKMHNKARNMVKRRRRVNARRAQEAS